MKTGPVLLVLTVIVELNHYSWASYYFSSWLAISFLSQEFVDDYNQFRERIADLDRRLASIVCQGFDDCASTEAALKVTCIMIFI